MIILESQNFYSYKKEQAARKKLDEEDLAWKISFQKQEAREIEKKQREAEEKKQKEEKAKKEFGISPEDYKSYNIYEQEVFLKVLKKNKEKKDLDKKQKEFLSDVSRGVSGEAVPDKTSLEPSVPSASPAPLASSFLSGSSRLKQKE